MTKPFLTFRIDRRGDTALVTIVKVTDTGQRFVQETLAEYETLSKGATASARREMKKHTV